MNKQLLSLSVCILLALAACSKSETETDQAGSQAGSQPTMQQAPATQAKASGGQMPMQGKVIKAMHAGGYTYMQVEHEGKQFWVAATMLNVKRNDHVAWGDAAVMKNFKSSSLRRTFDEILFVSAAKVL